MSTITLATKLADEAGVSIARASNFIEEVGPNKARALADDVAQRGQETVSGWLKAGATAGAVGGAGALAWRQQDVAKAKQIASQEQSRASAAKTIINSDLPAETKRKLTKQFLSGPSTKDKSGNGPLSGLMPEGLGGIQTTIGLVVVLAILVQFGGGE